MKKKRCLLSVIFNMLTMTSDYQFNYFENLSLLKVQIVRMFDFHENSIVFYHALSSSRFEFAIF